SICASRSLKCRRMPGSMSCRPMRWRRPLPLRAGRDRASGSAAMEASGMFMGMPRSADPEQRRRVAGVCVLAVVDAQVVLPQGDLGQAVADPRVALGLAVTGGVLVVAVGAEVAVLLGFGGERRPGQFDQQHVVEQAEHGLVVGDQVVIAV